jgi:hypothetical protein
MRKTKDKAPKRGRPRNSGLRVPRWAFDEISVLSARSGVNPQTILDTALKDGIQTTREPLMSWIKYQKSSDQLFNEYRKDTKAPSAPSEIPAGVEDVPDAASDREFDYPEAGLDVPDEQRGHEAEVLEPVGSLNGEE